MALRELSVGPAAAVAVVAVVFADRRVVARQQFAAARHRVVDVFEVAVGVVLVDLFGLDDFAFFHDGQLGRFLGFLGLYASLDLLGFRIEIAEALLALCGDRVRPAPLAQQLLALFLGRAGKLVEAAGHAARANRRAAVDAGRADGLERAGAIGPGLVDRRIGIGA